jgi:hypothetical protein
VLDCPRCFPAQKVKQGLYKVVHRLLVGLGDREMEGAGRVVECCEQQPLQRSAHLVLLLVGEPSDQHAAQPIRHDGVAKPRQARQVQQRTLEQGRMRAACAGEGCAEKQGQVPAHLGVDGAGTEPEVTPIA